MGVITKNILTGLITILPIALTLYLIYWLVVSTETLLGLQLMQVLPDGIYRPGLGVVVGIVILFFVGMLMHNYVVQRLFNHMERLFLHLPLVKQVYPSIRDFFDYFSPMKKKDFEQVVLVTLGETGMQAIGLVTQADTRRLPHGMREQDDRVLVYLPMSYMIGGYALLMPRSALKPLDMTMEEAMRFILTAGVAGTRDTQESARKNKPQPSIDTP